MMFRYVSAERDRHGRTRYRFRSPWCRAVMRERDPSTAAFRAEYDALLAREPRPVAPVQRPNPGSVAWLAGTYQASPEWAALRASTRVQRANVLRRVVAEHGHRDALGIDARAARALRNAFGQNGLKVLRAMYGWAIEAGKVDHNPFAGVKSARKPTDGFKPWSIEQVRQYVAHYPIGTREYLVMMLLLFTGLRRGDVVRVGPQHVKDGWLVLETEKTGVVAEVPIMPPLARAIAATVTGTRTYLVTMRGTPFAKESFGTWFRERVDTAGLPSDIAAHGVRKALAELLAELGCNDAQIMAILSHTTSRETPTYTRRTNRRRLAADAMAKLEGFAL